MELLACVVGLKPRQILVATGAADVRISGARPRLRIGAAPRTIAGRLVPTSKGRMRMWTPPVVIAALAIVVVAFPPAPCPPDKYDSFRAKYDAAMRSSEAAAAEHKRQIAIDDVELKGAALNWKEHVAPPPRAGDPPGTIRGVVQACDNDVEIVIVTAGTRDGVNVGSEFAVTRAGEPVATIVIDKVFPNYASGTFKPGTPKTPIQSGDECVGRARTDLPK
jgi:hypothetical protein